MKFSKLLLGAFAALLSFTPALSQSPPFNAGSIGTLGGNCTQPGSIPYQTSAGITLCTPLGTNGQIMSIQSGVPGWTTVGGTGTVTSVGLSLPSIFSVTGSPITTNGTLTGTLASQTAKTFFAAPNGAAGAPTFRTILASDLPAVSLTSGISGTLPIANGGTNATTAAAARTSLGVAIGTDVQAFNAALASIAGTVTTSNQMLYTTAADTYAATNLTAYARTLLDDVDATTARSTLGLGSIATQSASNVNLTGGLVGNVGLLTTTTFADHVADPTKKLQFNLQSLSSGSTRVITMPNKNIDLGKVGITDYGTQVLSGAAFNVTGIPSGVRRVDIVISGFQSSSAASIPIIRLGTVTSGIVTTGYVTTSSFVLHTASPEVWLSNDGLRFSPVSTSNNYLATISLSRMGSSNRWSFTGTGFVDNTTANTMAFAGTINLPDVLDRISFTTTGGTASITGAIDVYYQFDN